MAGYAITTDLIGTGVQINDFNSTPTLANGDILFITEGTRVISTGNHAVWTDLQVIDIRVDGQVMGALGAIELRELSEPTEIDIVVDVSGTGSVIGNDSYGLVAFNDAFPDGGRINVSNDGEIGAYNRAGVFVGAADHVSITNTGRIFSFDEDTNFANAVIVYAAQNGSLMNTGLIEATAVATNNASHNVDDTAAVSIRNMQANGTYTVINTGDIKGGSHSVFMEAYTSTLINEGNLFGHVLFNNDFLGYDCLADMRNSGDVFGDVTFHSSDDMLRNSGTIAGDVDLGDGADTFNGKGGTVEGTVYGGNGDDTYIVSDDTLILSEIGHTGTDLVKARANWTLGENFENLELIGSGDFRGVGNGAVNIITGNEGDNRLTGKGGNDTVNGADGNDRIFGGIGEDRISGDEGDDFIRGGISNDKVYGGDDDDMLRGNRGDDVLFGGGADDTLVGGVGRDTLFGGVGQDSFVFTRAGQSATGAEDVIRDFTQGEDLVDLSGLNREVTFIGTAAYSSGGAAEARTTEASGDTYLHVDLDGDGSAEMTVRLMDVTGLTAADLLL